MFDELMAAFTATIRKLAIEEQEHKVQKAKAEADLAKVQHEQGVLIFERVKQNLLEDSEADSIMNPKGGN